jgi:hypothetical protein
MCSAFLGLYFTKIFREMTRAAVLKSWPVGDKKASFKFCLVKVLKNVGGSRLSFSFDVYNITAIDKKNP